MAPDPIPFTETRRCVRNALKPMGQCVACDVASNAGPGEFWPRIELVRMPRQTAYYECLSRRTAGVVESAEG